MALAAATALPAACLAQRPSPEETPTLGPRDLSVGGDPVHVVLPPDAIPALTDPEMLDLEEADAVYAEDEPVLGVVIDGQARAYSLWHLDRHEIVNDQVGGRAIAATW